MGEIYNLIRVDIFTIALLIIFCVLVINTLLRSYKIRKIYNRMMKITGVVSLEHNISTQSDYQIM